MKQFSPIVTTENDKGSVLRTSAQSVCMDDLDEGFSIYQRLIKVRQHILKGGAGLAAPQIGIPQKVFIYSPDRTLENLKCVINPSFTPLNTHREKDWEFCYSLPLHAVQIKRFCEIQAHFYDLEGRFHSKILDGFEARVFQHEYDHVIGRLMIDHEGIDVKHFKTQKELKGFIDTLKAQPSYIPPHEYQKKAVYL